MKRFTQYINKPTPTKQMSATWSWHNVLPTPFSNPVTEDGRVGRGSWLLYHWMLDEDAQGMREVKKLSKESARAADHVQMNTTSKRVYASFHEVCQRPSGRPKYSSYGECEHTLSDR